jgi:hypothetical protein
VDPEFRTMTSWISGRSVTPTERKDDEEDETEDRRGAEGEDRIRGASGTGDGECELLGIARLGVYRAALAANDDDDLELMWRIDELFTTWPFLGSRRMTAMLHGEGHAIKAGAAVDAQDGDYGAGPQAAPEQAGAGPQDIPVSVAWYRDRAAEPTST